MQGSKLYVGNLKYSVTNADLEEVFSEYGKVQSANVIGDKGFAFVEMSSNSEAQKAKDELDGSEYEGRTLRIDEARPQKPRTERNFNRSY
jgi:RNA recognition motif-containing protein